MGWIVKSHLQGDPLANPEKKNTRPHLQGVSQRRGRFQFQQLGAPHDGVGCLLGAAADGDQGRHDLADLRFLSGKVYRVNQGWPPRLATLSPCQRARCCFKTIMARWQGFSSEVNRNRVNQVGGWSKDSKARIKKQTCEIM